ncbi:unnamed protein product [marine sediment metagenome]|uniref:Uncharacterized protein n=1 Tax=marine sediment metagenome TaxID=412755 RepID=X1SX37_9ZZZZ
MWRSSGGIDGGHLVADVGHTPQGAKGGARVAPQRCPILPPWRVCPTRGGVARRKHLVQVMRSDRTAPLFADFDILPNLVYTRRSRGVHESDL